MKALLAKKEKGFYCSAAALLCTVLGLVFFLLLASAAPEESENPAVIVIASFAALALHAVVCFKDYYKVPSIAAYAASTAAFLLLMGGRASYLAFYFSGDVLNTGLSVFMILAAVCYLAGLAAALLAVVFKQEKKDRAAFDSRDIKVLAPVMLIAVILCAATVLMQGGPADAGENGPQGEAGNGAAETYKTPTVDESVWQEYDGAAYLAEDESGKAIAYQLTGHTEIDTGEATDFDTLLNLYEDGESVLTVYGMNNVYTYFGYWTNEEDHLWFCVAHYGMAAMQSTCTIDYSYELTGMFDSISVNIALGFANGGQYVRETPIGGSGEVAYASVKDFLLEKGWTETDAGYRPLPGEAPGEDPVQNEALFSWESGSENYLLDCNADGTYTFTFASVGLVETGTWSWKDWTFTMTDNNGTVTTAEMDGDYALNLHYTAASSDLLTWDFVCDAGTWGYAFNGAGSYEPVSAPGAEQSSVLFSWESGSENYLLDCNADGTYAFTFASVGLVETGTWSWKDWTFTMTDSNGTVTTAEMDGDYALNLHYTAASSDLLTWDFVCDSGTWGYAFNGAGNYPAD